MGLIMIKMFRGASQFFGNGTVYITARDRIQRFSEHNFHIESLGKDGTEVWITDGIIVALGCACTPDEAIARLRAVIKLIKLESSRPVGSAKAKSRLGRTASR